MDYRWLPDRTIPMAYFMLKYADIKETESILDFGCAKGFLVKAFRLLNYEAYGMDISEYAVKHADPDIAEFIDYTMTHKVNWVIAKDVFEHLTEKEVEISLREIYSTGDKLFLVIPLGDGKKYNVPEYERDITHTLRQPKEWWEEKFKKQGWKIKKFDYLVQGIKDNWNHYPKGNGFWILEK